MPRFSKDHGETLREACINEAFAIIETSGLESLSLREVARRLGVSHQAPYKHFPSRDHILAEVVRRAYESFAAQLDSYPLTDNPIADLMMMGHAYLDFATTHPLQYRLMFGTPLPAPADHPDMLSCARHAFDLLCEAIRRCASLVGTPTPSLVEKDALFVWSSIHGFASLIQSNALQKLDLPAEVLAEMVQHLFQRIASALTTPT